MTLAALGIEAKTDGVDKTTDQLKELTGAAGKAEAATEKLSPAAKKAGADVKDLGKDAKTADGSLAKMASGAGKVVGALAAMALAAVSVAGLFSLVRRGADDMDAVAKSARRVGGTVTGFRAMELAAGEAGVAVSTLADAVQSMDREIAKGSAGAADALKMLGLSAKSLAGLDADAKLALVSDQIKAMGLSSGETSAALQGLGIRNKEMILAVQNGGDAFRDARKDIEDYGLGLSSIQTDKIEEANDRIGRLGLIGQYAGQQLSLALTPALGAMALAMTDSLREGGLLRGMIDGLAGSLQFLVDNFDTIAGVITAAATGLTVYFAPALVAGTIASAAFIASLITLKGALIATGIGAAVIAAGWLIGKFYELVRATGGWGNALTLLGDVAKGVWEGIKTSASSIPPALGAVWATIEAGFTSMIASMAGKWADFLHAVSAGMQNIPGMGDVANYVKGEAIVAGSYVYEMGAAAESASTRAKELASTAKDLVTKGFEDAAAAAGRLATAVAEIPAANPLGIPDLPSGGGGGGGAPMGGAGAGGGGGGGGGTSGALAGLITDLQTERELLNVWYAEKLALIQSFTDLELEQLGGRHGAIERLEAEHQERLRALGTGFDQQRLQDIGGAFGDLSSLMQSGNKRLFKIGQAAAIAEATVSGYGAAVSAWEKGMKIGGPPVAAAFTAASLAKTGMLIAKIGSQGGSGGGGGGGGSSAKSAQQSAPETPLRVTLDTIDPSASVSGAAIIKMFEAIQKEAGNRGIVWVPAGA